MRLPLFARESPGRGSSRRRFLVLLAAACLGGPVGSCRRASPRPNASSRPNVVLIIIDTLRSDALGCYRHEYGDLSPEIDALARDGAQFLNVTSQSSWTRPAIASMLTSLHPRSLGIYREKYDVLDDRFLTLAEVLRQHGYETVGMTANPNLNRIFNFQQGFDTYIESAAVFDWMRPEPGRPKAGKTILPDSRGVLRKMLDHARSTSSGKPLYMQITLMEVHEGWKLVRPEFKKNYRGLVGAPPGYWDGIRQVSFDVGWFVEELLSLRGWANTLFVITSDHGQGLDTHPAVDHSWGHGLLLYESQVKVPLILYSPARRATGSPIPYRPLEPQKVGAPVRLMDLMPTLLQYLGIPEPAGIHGKSLLPLLTRQGEAVGLPPYFVTETYYSGSEKVAVYSADWEYIENRDRHEGVNEFELQRTGIAENGRLTDRIGEQPTVAKRHADYLRDWERQFPKRKPTQPASDPSREVLDQLKALGYVN